MSFFSELKRRNVLRVGAAYIVMAWLVIQVVETLAPAFGFGDTAVRYVTILLAIGLVPALVVSWAFELTPEGLKKDADVDRSASIAPRTGRTLDRVIMVVLALGVTYFTVDKFVLEPQREAAEAEEVAARIVQEREAARTEALMESFSDKSIAVLPFVNMSPDPDQEYFSDGISEELLNLLAKIPELRVISRSSAFAFKDKDINIVEVAEQLNVAHVLEGSVRKSGDQIRVTAQLIEAKTDSHLWSETYDREMGDIFGIQDDIAAMVVDQLKLELLGDRPTSRQVDPAAYELFLRARHLSSSGDAEELQRSTELYQQALDIDPDYVPAWDELAVVYDNQVAMGLIPPEEGVPLARLATERALQLDPDYAPAHVELAWISMYYDSDPAAAAEHLERAQELDPDNISTLGVSALMLYNLGRVREALAVNQFVITRDPLNTAVRHNTSNMLFQLGRFDEAIESWRILLRMRPGHVGTHYFIGLSLLYRGDHEAALAEFEQESREPLAVAGKAMALHALDRDDEYRAELDELIEAWGDDAPMSVARVYATTGQVDKAFEWLNRAADAGRAAHHNPASPGFELLRDDVRWREFLERINKLPSQLERIEFEPRLPTADPELRAPTIEA